MGSTPAARATFARAARLAIEKRVPEARTPSATWGFKPNLAWVGWRLQDGRHAYIGLRRHLDWVTGEMATSESAILFDELPLLGDRGLDSADHVTGGRVRLGVLLHDEDRWWPAGETESELVERLEWLALQLRVKAERLLHANPAH
jgi:hypothetical protein